MLKAVMKAFVGAPSADEGQVAPAAVLDKDMADMTLGEQLNVALDEITASHGVIAELNTKLGDMAKEIEGYQEKLANLQQYADEAEAKALAAAEEVKAKELADKKAQLADIIGEDNPGFAEMFSAMEGLNAEAFNIVLNGMKASYAAEAKSPMFVEQGVSGECDVPAEEENATMRVIKQTYHNQ